MNIMAFVACLITLLVLAAGGAKFWQTASAQSQRLRSLLGRSGVQLAPSQRACPHDAQFAQVQHLIREDADLVTALEFLDDLDPRRSVLDRIGEISPSLFVPATMRLLGIGAFLAILFGPFFLAMLSVMGPVSELIESAGSSEFGRAAIIWFATALGVLFGMLSCLVVWHILFERHVLATMRVLEEQPLWSVGPHRRPATRSIILPKDDPGYGALRK